jgi:hypothetical protein
MEGENLSAPHVSVSYQGLLMASAQLSFTPRGVTPSRFTLTSAYSDEVLNNLKPTGDLVVRSEGGEQEPVEITFKDCLVTQLYRSRGPEGIILSIDVVDKRWKWGLGYIAGEYNIPRDSMGIGIRLGTAQNLEQLAILCKEAMHEPNIDTSALKEVPGRPHVSWDFIRPGQALQELCEEFGYAVVYTPVDDFVSINKIGDHDQGFLPTQGVMTYSEGLRPRPYPQSGEDDLESATTDNVRPDTGIRVFGDYYRIEMDLPLEAIAKETSGQIVKLENATYTPTYQGGGKSFKTWMIEDMDDCPNVLLQHGGRAHQAAIASAMRWFRVKVPFDLPPPVAELFKKAYPDGKVYGLDSFEMESELVTMVREGSDWKPAPAFAWGWWMDPNTKAWRRPSHLTPPAIAPIKREIPGDIAGSGFEDYLYEQQLSKRDEQCILGAPDRYFNALTPWSTSASQEGSRLDWTAQSSLSCAIDTGAKIVRCSLPVLRDEGTSFETGETNDDGSPRKQNINGGAAALMLRAVIMLRNPLTRALIRDPIVEAELFETAYGDYTDGKVPPRIVLKPEIKPYSICLGGKVLDIGNFSDGDDKKIGAYQEYSSSYAEFISPPDKHFTNLDIVILREDEVRKQLAEREKAAQSQDVLYAGLRVLQFTAEKGQSVVWSIGPRGATTRMTYNDEMPDVMPTFNELRSIAISRNLIETAKLNRQNKAIARAKSQDSALKGVGF